MSRIADTARALRARACSATDAEDTAHVTVTTIPLEPFAVVLYPPQLSNHARKLQDGKRILIYMSVTIYFRTPIRRRTYARQARQDCEVVNCSGAWEAHSASERWCTKIVRCRTSCTYAIKRRIWWSCSGRSSGIGRRNWTESIL